VLINFTVFNLPDDELFMFIYVIRLRCCIRRYKAQPSYVKVYTHNYGQYCGFTYFVFYVKNWRSFKLKCRKLILVCR